MDRKIWKKSLPRAIIAHIDYTIAMRPAAFHRGSTGRYVGSRGYYRQLENDIRFKELANHEIYAARTECCASTSSLSCEMRLKSDI